MLPCVLVVCFSIKRPDRLVASAIDNPTMAVKQFEDPRNRILRSPKTDPLVLKTGFQKHKTAMDGFGCHVLLPEPRLDIFLSQIRIEMPLCPEHSAQSRVFCITRPGIIHLVVCDPTFVKVKQQLRRFPSFLSRDHQRAKTAMSLVAVCRSYGHGLPSKWSSNSLRNFFTNAIVGIAAASPSGQNVLPSMFSAR